MENFKFFLFSVFIIALLGAGGYWAFSTMESGSSHVDIEKQKALERENEDLKDEISDLKDQISKIESDKVVAEQEAEQVEKTQPEANTGATVKPETTTSNVSKYQTLINELQKLVDSNIYLKNKSQGPAVGTVQKFLNIYNNTSNKVDNDFGASTETAIKNFQKAQGLTADGEVGPGTLKKMISWLKGQ